MTLRRLLLATFSASILLVSIIGWYALDFSQSVSDLLMVPGNVSLTLAVLWAACLGSLGVLAGMLLVLFVRPLDQLRAGALRIAAGDYHVRLPVADGSEIGDLQAAFNRMAQELEARAQVKERYRIVFDNANIGISQATLDGRLVAVNPALTRLLGYSAEELVGRSWQDITHPDDFDRQSQDHAALLAGMVSRYRLEKRYRRKDGTEVWVDVTVALAGSADGPCVVVTANDITARRLAQAAQERYAADLALFREVVNQSNDMLLMVDESDGRFIDVNDTACAVLGYSRQELLELRLADVAIGANDEVRHQRAEQARNGGLVFESAHRRKDGKVIPVEVSLTMVARGGRRLAVAVARDISERLSREEQLRLLLEATEDGIYAVDLQGRFILCNRAAARMLGYDDAAELIGLNAHALVHHSHPDGTPYAARDCPVHDALDHRQVSRVETEVLWRKDGTSFPVAYSIYPMVRLGTVVGAVISFVDATAKRNAEAAQRHAQKMQALSSLTGGIAHEINNLLMPILTLGGMTLKEMPEGSRARLRLEKITDAAARAKDLIARLGAFALHGSGTSPRAPTDLVELAASVVAAFRANLPAGLEVEQAGDGTEATVVVDAAALEIVVANLLSNAADAMAGRPGVLRVAVGRVAVDETLRLRVPDLTGAAYVRLCVEDHGKGMDEETVKRMFDPFFTTKDVGAGTGLGLAVVHGIVAAHGGAIAVTSHPGQGTMVEVFLPA